MEEREKAAGKKQSGGESVGRVVGGGFQCF